MYFFQQFAKKYLFNKCTFADEFAKRYLFKCIFADRFVKKYLFRCTFVGQCAKRYPFRRIFIDQFAKGIYLGVHFSSDPVKGAFHRKSVEGKYALLFAIFGAFLRICKVWQLCCARAYFILT